MSIFTRQSPVHVHNYTKIISVAAEKEAMPKSKRVPYWWAVVVECECGHRHRENGNKINAEAAIQAMLTWGLDGATAREALLTLQKKGKVIYIND